MTDKAHRLTDEKLEEMEKRLSAIYSRAEKTVQKKMADYAKTIDEKSSELLQAYKDAETEEEKRKAKKAYISYEEYGIHLEGGLANSFILQSPNGNRYTIAVTNDGELIANPL